MADDRPKDLDVIRKDAKLTAALMAYMKRSMCDENFFFYFDKGNPQGLYPKYLSSKAPRQVNLPGQLITAFDKLGGAEDWDNKAWPKLIKAAKTEIKRVVASDTLVHSKFYTSKEYLEYVAKNKMGDPKKAAKILGISNVKLLTEAMSAQATGDKKGAIKLFTELAKKEKIKQDAESMVKALTKAGLV